jgi:uncharacterized protein
MRLGFDLDEVVVNTSEKIVDFIQTEYGIEWSRECFNELRFEGCTFIHNNEELNKKIQQRLVGVANDPDLQSEAEPIEGARDVLQKLAHSGHKIFFVTSRPKRNQPSTFKWLRKHDIPFDKLVTLGTKPKGPYAKKFNLDMFVDDQVKNLESLLRHKKRWRKGLLLYDCPWNLNGVDGTKFIRVYNWLDILRQVGVANR